MNPARAIADAVAAGQRSAVDVIAEHLERIAADTELNAFTRTDPERSLAAAATVDERVASGATLPLAGVPVALKDIVDEAGVPTTSGSSFYAEVAAEDATVVARLKGAGAVIVGRTGLHEFAYGFSSENHWWGPVRNPWDPATSPGGSSGGSAAAVAGGLAPLAIGTDTGGSVRVPAALCGIVGLKVTHGRGSLRGVFPLAPSLDTVGPLATSVGDAAASYAVIGGHDPADPWSVPRPVELPDNAASLAGLRVAIPHPWVDRALDGPVAAAWQATLDHLADAGAELADVPVPAADPEGLTAGSFAEVATVHRAWFEAGPERYGPEVAARLEVTLQASVDDATAALRWRAGVRTGLLAALDGHDILLTPATAVGRKVIGEDLVTTSDGAEHYRRALSWFSTLVNQAGLPALTLPVAGTGRPPGAIQLIGHPWGERDLLQVGLALEGSGLVRVELPQ